MVIGTLIDIIEKIVGDDGVVSPIKYRGGKTTSNTVYVIPNFKKSTTQNDILMKKIEVGLRNDSTTSSLSIQILNRENKIKIGSFFIFIKPYSKFDPKRVERKQIKTLYEIFNHLDNAQGSPFKIKIGKKTYEIDLQKHKLATIQEVKAIGGRERKSDAIIRTENEGNIYISLKGNTSQQWSGVSEFKDDLEIQNFQVVLHRRKFQNKSIHNVCKRISQLELTNKTLYGKDYSSGSFGYDNVNHIIIGEDIKFYNVSGKDFTVIKGLRTYDNGDRVMSKDYPHIQSSNDSKRNDLGFPKTRITVWRGIKGTVI